MPIVVASVAFVVAALCAGVMGYAIQRGATCTVAAVDEIVTQRSYRRLLSLLEAALWVAGGLVVAQSLHLLPPMPSGYAISGWTMVGGALLGLGAYINGACVFGAIARFGSGDWAYIVTPIGFYLGCLSVVPLFGVPMPTALGDGSPVLRASAAVAVAFVAFALWRLVRPWLGRGEPMSVRWHEALAARVWSPHAATTVIGITFVVMLLLVGGWAYTDALAELARGMSASVVARLLLAVSLLLGAALGGWTAGLFRSTRVSPTQLLRCLVGGVLMGWGSLLLPGGNDGLILVAMPLAWPYAWLAFATMCITIATAQLLGSRRRPRR
ncbi:MAG TPA: YeeE/YedE thiosulfate transporter family protein [Caldimonas sp.]|nr:YeeE/YedE thiosulfate transporter family protein [Caldimonas sp.]